MAADDLHQYAQEANAAASDPALLDKDAYETLRAQLVFRPDLRLVALTVVVNQLLAALGLWLLSSGSTSGYVAAQLIFPVVFFQAFSILHDCGHGSCLPRNWQNALLGHYISVACFLPYYPWKYVHAQHHAWTGNLERDPTLKVLRRWRASRRVPWLMRVAWRTWIPLGAVINHLVLWTHPLLAARTATSSQLRRLVLSTVWLLVAYLALHHSWPALFRIGNFAPAIVVYLIAVELVNLPHHADLRTTDRRLALWEQGHSTRTCYYPPFVSEFLVLNFNFHIEHHLFPTLPWYRLRRARALVMPALGAGYQQAVGIDWNLKRRSKDIAEVLNAS